MDEKCIINKFTHRRGIEDCKTLAIRDVFEFYGINMDAEICIGLGSGLNFEYYKVLFGTKEIPVMLIAGRNMDLEKDLCCLFNVKRIEHKVDNAMDRWGVIKQYIDTQNPVYIELQGEYLRGDIPSKQSDTAKIAVTSGAVAFGYEEKNEETFIFLTNGVYRSHIKLCLSDLICAMDANYIPFPPEKKFFTFDFSNAKRDIKTAIIPSIQKVLKNMLEGEENNKGIKGMNLFIDDFEKTLSLAREENNKKYDKYISILFKSVLTGYGAASSSFFRGEYGRFLNYAADILKRPDIGKCGEDLTKLSRQYFDLKKILNGIQKDQLNMYERGFDFINKFRNSVQQENEILIKLKKILES